MNALLYDGPSRLGPHPIVVLATPTSKNSKTGDMKQVYILLRDIPPTEAIRSGDDATICGDCVHRGVEGRRTCYVSMVVGGPSMVWKAYQRGLFEPALSWLARCRVFDDAYLRIGAYGDPAALPFKFWYSPLLGARGWTGYTHQWRTCSPDFAKLFMASVEDEDEAREAQRIGYRTYRARPIGSDLLPGEFQCPAADEAGHRTTCRRCLLCRGLASPAKSVSIELHGQRFKGTRGEDWLERRDSLGLLRTQLDAGHVIWKGTPQDVSRIRFALSMWYRRHARRVRVAIRRVKDGYYEMRLR